MKDASEKMFIAVQLRCPNRRDISSSVLCSPTFRELYLVGNEGDTEDSCGAERKLNCFGFQRVARLLIQGRFLLGRTRLRGTDSTVRRVDNSAQVQKCALHYPNLLRDVGTCSDGRVFLK
jgi:hypothetical protein